MSVLSKKPLIAHAAPWIWSTTDQAAVSLGNFLAVILAARFLTGVEQAWLIYGYTIYLGVLLLGVAVVFTAAPIVAADKNLDVSKYRRSLTRVQTLAALVLALVASAGLAAFSGLINFPLSVPNLTALFGFLLFQQLADYFRRHTYVFFSVRPAAIASLGQLFTRLVLILTIKPDTAADMFALLTLAALPGAFAGFVRQFRDSCADPVVSLPVLHWKLSRWSFINAPVFWVAQFSPILLTGYLGGAIAAATLGSIRVLSTAANVFIEQIDTVISVKLAASNDKAGRRKIVFGTGIVGIFAWTIVLLLILLAGKEILTFLLGNFYGTKVDVLLILWCGTGVYFLGKLIAVALRTARLPIAELVGSLAGCLMLVIDVPGRLLGVSGAQWGAWSLLGVQVALVIGQLFAGKYCSRMQE